MIILEVYTVKISHIQCVIQHVAHSSLLFCVWHISIYSVIYFFVEHCIWGLADYVRCISASF